MDQRLFLEGCDNSINSTGHMGQDLGDVGSKAIVDIVGTGQHTDGPISNFHGLRRQDSGRVDKKILDNPDCGTQSNATRRTCQGSDQLEEEVEMLGQERVKASKSF